MCGFLGAVGNIPLPVDKIPFYRTQSTRLSARGNTSHGEFISRDAALFHYRLAFRDLASGDQPMLSPDRKQILVYNGELYGFRKLRAQLSYPFTTQSDTEVLLAAWQAFGETMLGYLDGEFAFAIWDEAQEQLTLARDAFGIKPLYLASQGLGSSDQFRTFRQSYAFGVQDTLFFASEMKGLPLPMRWEQEGLRRQFVGLYEEIATPFQGVIQIPPGAMLIAKRRQGKWECRIERKLEKKRQVSAALGRDFQGAAVELRDHVRESVRARLDADVPLGAYLSGGVDSRAVAYEMLQAGYEFPSFTIGFEGADYDESGAVRDFVHSQKGIHGHLLKSTNRALDYSYPIAIHASEIIQPYTNGCAKWWLSRFTRRYVRGVLTGDGADELFCGYPSYRYLAWWRFYQRNPSPARLALYHDRLGISEAKPWEKGISSLADGTDLQASQAILGWEHPLFHQVETLAQFLLGSETAAKTWLTALAPSLASYSDPQGDASPLLRWQNYFLHTHFPTHVLNWVGDRMEMANTLEGRPPLLSKAILDFQRQLPDNFLVRGMRDKAILRRAYSDELKRWALAPKKQFNAPFLFDGPLGSQYLSPESITRAGVIPEHAIARARLTLQNSADPMLQSYAKIFLQNCLVVHILHETLVEGKNPARDLAWEEAFLDQNTEIL